ncbi:hypothetical protein M408DRAFT_7627 [Serendipita vermifera MAFF 305830]|uniref:DH domain-containing protein n=1 Tax=Serendipita vermifera MAFF 305830 TaxID=933852 RepID=A0A0C3B1E9_SERVB|nr:hypothetical protein M408DRAFT_7627 [Serendipita vermifera MAFF 305830]
MTLAILTITPMGRSHKLAQTPPIDIKSREKGKLRVPNLSFGDVSKTSPAAQKDAESDSYYLSLPHSSDNSDVTPTATSLKSGGPKPPPTRSPHRQSQQGSPRHRGTTDRALPPTEPLPVLSNDDTLPIPRQSKADSEAAKARRREAYKSGMSFVSLYELYTEPPPPVPIPPVPVLDRSNLASTTGSGSLRGSRARSGSNSATKEQHKNNSSHGPATTISSNASTTNGHTRARSGSLGLANATISSSVTVPVPSPPLSSEGVATPAAEPSPPTRSKRQHILFEILDTERIYSSDMALIKAVHLPLALGLKIDFGPMGSVQSSARSSTDPTADPNGPSRSSGISTNSSQSQSGSSGYPATNGFPLTEPPMSVEDTKVIFANMDELAEFTGRFTEFIQLALGSEIDGGLGHDKIGALFLEMYTHGSGKLPIMAPIYETYITKHSASIARLNALVTEHPTPAMASYIQQTKAIASTHSNSWDLNSLLIKPIQRFLKYPLLLESLVMATPDTHPDKPDLIRAKTAMVEASRLVNEQTQKVEICRTILQRKPLTGLSAVFSSAAPNSQQLKVKGSKSVFAVTKSKDAPPNPNPNPNPTTPSPSITPFDAAFDPIQLENRLVEHASGGAGGLEALIHHLQGFESLIPHYVKDVVTWVRSVRETLVRLEKWAIAFERVITLDDTTGIEALDAFKAVLTDRLSPILDGLETAVKIILIPTLGKIQDSMKGPTLLLNTAASLRTVHNQLMNTPYISKTNRPSPQVVEGSKTYLALMQQLRTDLPVYVRHLDKMFAYVILEVAKWQERWHREVGQGWSDLWTALDVGPGSRKEYRARKHREQATKKRPSRNQLYASDTPEPEVQRGAYGCNGEETAAMWWDRWEGVNLAINALGVPSGAALQGVRELQGLIKNPPAAAPGIDSPLEAPGTSYSNSYKKDVIHEVDEDDREEDFYPPGYFPNDSPTERKSYAPSRYSSSTQDIGSPTHAHPINSFLPAVSPGPIKKGKSPKMKTVSFPASLGSNEGPENITKLLRRERESTVENRHRTRSEERASHKAERPEAARSVSNLEASTSAGGSKTLPRGSSFRKRLSENMWFGEASKKTEKANQGGLELDVEELEAAVATTNAREEREAEVPYIAQKNGINSNDNANLARRPSNASMSADPFRKRKISLGKESGSSGARSRRMNSISSGRSKPSVDIPRNAMSEYGRTLVPTLDAVGPSFLSDDAPIMFTCTAVAVFTPKKIRYAGLPFLYLDIGDLVNIVKDAGRPSDHPDLEPVVSDGIDTLFIGKKLPDRPGAEAEVGWLWASFVMPLEG